MKQPLKHLFSFLVRAIASACFVAWICGVFSCLAADFNDQSLEYNDDLIKIFDHYPSVAEDHEEIYDRFLNGKLIYRPNGNNDEGKVELRIADLADPLEGTFDLSQCGDAGKYLSISTGYRKGKRPENKEKIEIWICPRFLIEKEFDTTASHFGPIMGHWIQEWAPVGLFWNRGGWDIDVYDYLTTKSMDNLFKCDLGSSSWGQGFGVGERGFLHLIWLPGNPRHVSVRTGFSFIC